MVGDAQVSMAEMQDVRRAWSEPHLIGPLWLTDRQDIPNGKVRRGLIRRGLHPNTGRQVGDGPYSDTV